MTHATPESRARRRPTRGRSMARLLPVLAGFLMLMPNARAEEPQAELEYANDAKVGIEQNLGGMIPKQLTFSNAAGETVQLGALLNKPTVLTLVYFRCPGICSPLMHELAHTVDEVDLVAGRDFDLITVSFDARENPKLASAAKQSLLSEMDKKVDPAAWHFLTGDEQSIMRLADAVGFRFQKDGEDFKHAATVVFLSKDGKIISYLGGLTLLPFDMSMAILDATKGAPRTLIQRVQKICYAYDPEGRNYVIKVNQIVLYVTLFGVGVFVVVFLIIRRRPRKPGDRTLAPAPAGSDLPEERPV